MPQAELVVMGANRQGHPGADFMGPVDDSTKAHQLSSSAILVAPNTSGESFGLVILEGLAAGCAVVASSLPAFQYVAGDAAVLVPPGDPAALAQALNRLLGDPDLLTEYQERARRRAETFDRRQVVADYLKVYAQAVDKTGE